MGNENILLNNKQRSEISDDEPLYDSVASDDDYGYIEKISSDRSVNNVTNGLPCDKASEEELRKSLTSSQATITRLQSEIKHLQDTVSLNK